MRQTSIFVKAACVVAVLALVTACDDGGGSGGGGGNTAPSAVNDAYTVAEDAPLIVSAATGVLANDSDPNGDTMTAVIVANATQGVLALASDGSFTYTPSSDFNGADTFTYNAADGTTQGNTASVTITVTPANDAPTSTSLGLTLNEDAAVTYGTPVVADIDAGETFTFAILTLPANGTASVSGSQIGYVPDTDFNGFDTFTYRATDSGGLTADGTATAAVSAVNDPPASASAAITTDEDTPSTGTDPLVTDVDAGDSHTFAILTQPSNGSASVVSNQLVYTPGPGFSGSDSFTFLAVDSEYGAVEGTASVTVNAVNYAPTATSAIITTDEDTVSAGVDPSVTDPDAGDTHTFTILTPPANGSASVVSNQLVYTPSADYAGSDSFTYRAEDPGTLTVDGTATVTVTGINDAPTATSAAITTDEDTASTGDTPSVSDVDTGDTFTYAILTQGTNGTASIASNQLVYTPNAEWNGSDSFTYRATDSGSATVDGTASVTVNAVNDAPSASSAAIATDEDTTSVGVVPSVTDIDDASGHTFTIQAQPVNGTASVVANELVYDPDPNYFGSDSFTFRATDAGGLYFIGTASVTVNSIEDLPTIGGTPLTPVNSDLLYSFTPTSNDNDPLDSLSFTASGLPAWLILNPTTGRISGTPHNDEAGDVSTTYSNIIITVSDGDDTADLGPFSITVNDVTPTSGVGTFNAAAGNGSIALSWTDPSDTDFAGTLILRRSDLTYPTDPADPLATVVYDGATGSYTDNDVVNGTMYYYRAYAHDEVPNYGTSYSRAALPMAGNLETGFASSGKFGWDNSLGDVGYDMAVDGSGNILVVGETRASGQDWVLMRLTSAGALDSTFGTAGIALIDTTAVSATTYYHPSIALDGSGNILVACSIYTTSWRIALYRFTAAGALDTTFAGGSGFVTFLGGQASGIAIDDSSGDILVCGIYNNDMVVVSYTSAGVLNDGPGGFGQDYDISGSPDGYVLLESGQEARAYGMCLDGTRNILVTGAIDNGTSLDMVLARFTPTGAVDVGASGFGIDYVGEGDPDGYIVSTDVAAGGTGNDDNGRAVAVDNAGRIVVCGDSETSPTSGRSRAVLWRFLADGSALDPTFNAVGYYITNANSRYNGSHGNALEAVYNDLVVEAGGSILATGIAFRYHATYANHQNVILTRIFEDGTADAGLDGIEYNALLATAMPVDEGYGMLLESGGTVLLTGGAIAALGMDLFVMRVDPGSAPGSNTRLDPAFNGVGYATYAGVGGLEDQGDRVRIDGSGNVVVAGRVHNGSDLDTAIWRYSINGTLDAAFGAGGVQIDGNSSLGSNEDYARDFVFDGTGKIVLSGFVGQNVEGDMGLWRHTAVGAQELAVSHDAACGIANSRDIGFSVLVDGSDNYVVAGSSLSTYKRMALWCFDTAGAPVPAFDTDGVAVYDDAAGDSYANKIVRDSDTGDLIVVGETRISNGPVNSGAAIWRYTSAGAPIGAFGTGGIVTYDTPGAGGDFFDIFADVALDGSGNIVVTGYGANAAGDYELYVARYTSAGALDTSFGTGGVTRVDVGGRAFGMGLAIDGSDRIIVAGAAGASFPALEFAAWRFTASGALDTGFGTGGVFTSSGEAGGTGGSAAFSVTLDGSGRIVATGIAADAGGESDMCVWRIIP